LSRVINISEASSIAIHSLALIAESDYPINVKHLADLTGFSKNHISKILLTLVKNGYLESERGPKGGFLPKKAGDSITLLEVIELLEGNIEEEYCRKGIERCPFNICVFGGVPEKLTKEFRDYFAGRKISDIKVKSY
jgi:Rrf2 family protein